VRYPQGSARDEEKNITMAAPLGEILLAPGTKPQVIDDCCALIEAEISEKSGVSGTAIKLAYKTVTTFKPGHIRFMVGRLLPEIVDRLEPYWAGFTSSGGSDFGGYLTKYGDEVAEALLSITDRHGAASDRPTIVKAYNAVRGSAAKHIQAALPRVGDLVLKYAG
jgi:hypothetical protein